MTTAEFGPTFAPDGRIVDFLSGILLEDRPEERVRQKYLKILHFEHRYPKEVMAREVPISYGAAILLDDEGNPRRADIVVYENAAARDARDQGQIRFLVENKAPDETTGHNQLMSYLFTTSANGAVWYNGTQTKYFHRETVPENRLTAWPGIPGPGESWDSVGRQRKSQLLVPADIKGLLKRCHDRLYRRGTAGDDITLDMVRVLIAKTRDEEKPGDTPAFYCTSEEYSTPAGRAAVADRVRRLFEEFRDANPSVFSPTETITVGADAIAEVVSELQHYRLVSADVAQWDVMGAVYEQYTADELKREGGEFFTNRLVVNLLVRMLDPTPDDTVLDPAGGTGGFVTSALRHVRTGIKDATIDPAIAERQIAAAARRIFYVDIKHRLVKIAKTAMLLTGDGHAGCIQGDSLHPMADLNPAFLRDCQPGRITRVLTNPPFAGTAQGRISDPAVLTQFDLGKRWEWRGTSYQPTGEISRTGVPPEMLFVERCIQWLAPGGRLGIVLPKGVLDTTEPHLATRNFLFGQCRVLAVISCHKNTFQPYTGVRTALLVLEKKAAPTPPGDGLDYPIFMAVSRKIGQDSEGEPIFRLDDDGRPTAQVDADLDEIFASWQAHNAGTLTPSEYVFTVDAGSIDTAALNINPQHYLPSLNESLRLALQLGDRPGWTASTIGDLAQGIYKGSRFKREDLETEEDGPEVRMYFTPAALLQERGESIKKLDLSRATTRRRATLALHELRRGQLLITRSGTVGRIILVMDAHVGHIGSDDLIRVEIEDEEMRHYVYGFLKSRLGQDQMKRNEYGTIQQHLEPRHIRDIIVPIPDDPAQLSAVARSVRESVEARERSFTLEAAALGVLSGLMTPDAFEIPD